MFDVTRVYLITGFLGSGKTTFLKRLIQRFPKDKKLMLLLNEFGEVGVDGTLIEGDDIDMIEISKGSIFCACVKADFIKSLYEINTKVQPDIMLIESTGVANPSDLKKDLKLPLFNNRFQFIEQFCVIDAAHFLDAYNIYAALEKQIATSTVFIINKIDVASPETIEETKNVIRRFHPNPVFHETIYADIPLEEYFDLEEQDSVDSKALKPGLSDVVLLSNAELDEFIDNLLDRPDLEIAPPDTLVSVTYQWNGKNLEQIRIMADALPPSVVRAKGILRERGNLHLFNYVMGDWTIEAAEMTNAGIKNINIVVFIGPPESLKGIDEASTTGNLTSTSGATLAMDSLE